MILLLASLAHAACPSGTTEQSTADATACVDGQGRWQGSATWWQAPGVPAEEGIFVDGVATGPWTLWHPNGQLAMEGEVTDGERSGEWHSFDDQGRAVATLHYAAVDTADEPGQDGEEPWALWQREAAQPLDVAEGVLIARDSRGLLAVDLETGDALWRAAEATTGPAHRGGADLALLTARGDVLVVSTDGERTTRIDTVREPTALAGLIDGVVVIREDVGRLVGLDAGSGEILWKSRQFYGPQAPLELAERLVAVRNREVHALDAVTGDKVWSVRLGSAVTALEWADGVIVARAGAEAVRLDPETGLPQDLPAGGEGASGEATEPSAAPLSAAGPRLPELPLAGDPLVVGGLALLPTADRLVAAELSAFAVLDGVGDADAWLPGDEVEVQIVTPEASRWVTLAQHLLITEGEDCREVRSVLELPEEGWSGPADLEIPEIVVQWTPADADWRFHDRWDASVLDTSWSTSWSYWWTPAVVEARARRGGSDAQRLLDDVLSCRAEAGQVDATLVSDDGQVRHVYEGRLDLRSFPHELDGQPGCTVEGAMGGERIGFWRGLQQDGWMSLDLLVVEPTQDDPVLAEGVVAGVLGERAVLESVWDHTGRSEPYQLSRPSLYLSNGVLLLRSDAVDVAAMPVPGLRPVDGADRPVLHWEQSWELVGQGVTASEPYLEIWRSDGCAP